MKIYEIIIKDYYGYDSYDAHVVCAENEEQAREMCPNGDEGSDTWTKPSNSDCVEVGTSNENTPRVILSSFNAG